MPFVAWRAFGWESCEITADWGLRSVPQGLALPLCNSLHCPNCGMLFLDMRFDDADMSRLYRDYRGDSYVQEREHFEPGYAARNQALTSDHPHIQAAEAVLRPWLPDQPAILDWGGDTGRNTPLRQVARLHHIYDISGRLPVEGAVPVSTPTAAAYDLIVLSNVLEHVPDPRSLLGEVSRVMSPSSKLYLELPFEALMRESETQHGAWRSKRHWHEHVNFFSSKALTSLIQRSGLEVLSANFISLPDGALQFAWVCGPATGRR